MDKLEVFKGEKAFFVARAGYVMGQYRQTGETVHASYGAAKYLYMAGTLTLSKAAEVPAGRGIEAEKPATPKTKARKARSRKQAEDSA